MTNTSGSAVSGWTLGFDLPAGVTVQTGWNGAWSQQGRSVTIRDVGWNAVVPAGGSVAVGFVANGTAAPLSTPVTFAGSACTVG